MNEKYLLQILAALQNNFKQWKFNQYYHKHFFKHYSATSKTVVKTQSWIELLWNSISSCFFFSFLFWNTDFPFYSLILPIPTLHTYKLTWRKLVCIFLVNFSSKLFIRLKENPRKMHFPAVCRPIFKKFSLWCLPWSNWAKKAVKKLNLWGERAVDKSAWIKASINEFKCCCHTNWNRCNKYTAFIWKFEKRHSNKPTTWR